MGNSYTELFFLDEATAFTAGHRPCFECRRAAAVQFAELWSKANGQIGRAKAPDMDKVLHTERLSAPDHIGFQDLPEFSMFVAHEKIYLKHGPAALEWSFEGYGKAVPMDGPVQVLTPPSVRRVLAAGYVPQLHESIT